MVEIRLDDEKLLRHILIIEGELNQIRREAAMGTAKKPSPPDHSIQGIDITKIDWKGKGSIPVHASADWSWAFAYEQEGGYKPESKALVQAIEQTGKVEIDGYEMTLSGRDNNLLNRKKTKSKGRGR